MLLAHAYELLVYFIFILQHSPNITDINKNKDRAGTNTEMISNNEVSVNKLPAKCYAQRNVNLNLMVS